MTSTQASTKAILTQFDIDTCGIDHSVLRSLGAYLSSPSLGSWLRIRENLIDPHASLEYIWRLDDVNASAKGSFVSFPGPATLARSLRSARKLFLRQIDTQVISSTGIRDHLHGVVALVDSTSRSGWGELRGCMDSSKNPLHFRDVNKIHEYLKNPSRDGWLDIFYIRIFGDDDSSLRNVLQSSDEMHRIKREKLFFPTSKELRLAISEFVQDGYFLFNLRVEQAQEAASHWLAIQAHALGETTIESPWLTSGSTSLTQFKGQYQHAWKCCEFELEVFRKLFAQEVPSGHISRMGFIDSAISHFDESPNGYPL